MYSTEKEGPKPLKKPRGAANLQPSQNDFVSCACEMQLECVLQKPENAITQTLRLLLSLMVIRIVAKENACQLKTWVGWHGYHLYQHPKCKAAKPCGNKILAKGETERENSKQAPKTIFHLNSFTSQRAAKT